MTMTALARRRYERASQQSVEDTCAEALERAREAVAKAKTALRLTVQMAAHAVNDELNHVPNAQAVARACLLKEDIEATCITIEQHLDDLLFQPMNLLSKEAGE